ncbi:hypothetical protein [Thalassotalea sp. PLHSN55]|uniref:SHOCT domain-containing protein n=1 Tax=Thalassotalea sp. PLHSN55 TaxID=3435888 RepID=UPI003F865A2D
MSTTSPVTVKNLLKRISSIFSAYLLLSTQLLVTQVYAQPFQVNEVATLKSFNSQAQWLTPIAVPSYSEKVLLGNSHGQLSFFSSAYPEANVILEMNKLANNSKFIKLTAMAMHPSFALREQNGTAVIYTAHIEHYNAALKAIRLTANEEKHAFDLVVLQWQLNPANKESIDINSKREVLRLNVPSEQITINQLGFNPYVQSWDDNYGLLHIAITSEDAAQQAPLYSGAILRINPEKFGLKSYTIPASNPFNSNATINNEIITLGLNKLNKFLWQKRNTNQFIIHHNQAGLDQLSLVNIGDNFLTKTNSNTHVLWQASEQQQLGLPILYSGRAIPELRDQLLFLVRENTNLAWQLSSIPLTQLQQNQQAGNLVADVPLAHLTSSSKVALFLNGEDRLAIHDQDNHNIIELSSTQSKQAGSVQTRNEKQNESANSNANNMLILLLLVLAGVGVYWFKFRPNNKKDHGHLYKTFARFELDNEQQTLAFYDRHSDTVKTTLAVNDISASEVLLNESSINLINADAENGFNETIETEIRNAFAKEYRDKMIDGKIRHFDISITDVNNKTFSICLYYRKGNQRLTKIKYEKALEQCIDWCWFIAEHLNTENTAKRIVAKATVKKVQKKVTTKATSKPAPKPAPIKKNVGAPTNTDKNSQQIHSNSGTDTAIVDALDKLVNLKQQGFINEREFELAKAKLLQDLVEN